MKLIKSAAHNGIKNQKKTVEWQSYAMIAPQIVGFLVFSLYPIIWVFGYAFYDYDGYTSRYIGIENFIRAFTRDPAFWKSILNTFIIAYGKLIVELPLALIVALLLANGAIKVKKIFSVGYYMPMVTGTATNCLIFSFLFATFNGTVNNMLMKIGAITAPIEWFSQKWTAMFVIMLESLWAGFAANVLYFMAGVQNVSEDVLEAADIDGAGRFTKFFKVTMPMLAPVIRVILMLAMVNGVKIMNEVLLLTNGGPSDSTNVVMLHIYKMYFVNDGKPQLGYASALGIITTVILGIITFAYLRLSKKSDSVG